ncbi:MAG: Hsp20/alpha crystallin family protein [Ruminococcus sp.]|nr:Hsp20/alpha crystallin family protein [Ruminococcus sp.]
MYALTPFERTVRDVFRSFDDDFFSDFGTNQVSSFRTDIKDEGDKYVLEAELPGFDKEDINLDITGKTLTLSAEHSSQKDDDTNKNYIRRERSYGAYRRTFDLSQIDTDNIDAQYKNGVLYLTMPKKEPTAPASRRLEIK